MKPGRVLAGLNLETTGILKIMKLLTPDGP